MSKFQQQQQAVGPVPQAGETNIIVEDDLPLKPHSDDYSVTVDIDQLKDQLGLDTII